MPAGRRHLFSEADDDLIRKQASGECPLSAHRLSVTLGATVEGIERRAKELGVVIRKSRKWSREARERKLAAEKKIYDEIMLDDNQRVYEPVITVGRKDELLERLKRFHGDG